MRKKNFWESKATVHITLTEEYIYILDVLAREKGISKSKIIADIIKESNEIKEFKKKLGF